MADLENGPFRSNTGGSQNLSSTGNRAPYVTATLKNNGQNFFAIKDGDAQSGGLTTRYAGALPTSRPGHAPTHQEDSIVVGFNNTPVIASNGSSNTFDSADLWVDDVSWIVASPGRRGPRDGQAPRAGREARGPRDVSPCPLAVVAFSQESS